MQLLAIGHFGSDFGIYILVLSLSSRRFRLGLIQFIYNNEIVFTAAIFAKWVQLDSLSSHLPQC